MMGCDAKFDFWRWFVLGRRFVVFEMFLIYERVGDECLLLVRWDGNVGMELRIFCGKGGRE